MLRLHALGLRLAVTSPVAAAIPSAKGNGREKHEFCSCEKIQELCFTELIQVIFRHFSIGWQAGQDAQIVAIAAGAFGPGGCQGCLVESEVCS